jgi:hypothetical protein
VRLGEEQETKKKQTMPIRVLRREPSPFAPHFHLDVPPRRLIPFVPHQEQGGCTRDSFESLCKRSRSEQDEFFDGFEISQTGQQFSAGPTRILPNVFLGNFGDAQCPATLAQYNIRRILNVSRECCDTEAASRNLLIMQVPIDDHSDEDIEAWFDRCTSFIYEGRSNNEATLVHCRMGVSRSATIVIAFLMRFGLTAEEAELSLHSSSGNAASNVSLMQTVDSKTGPSAHLSYAEAFSYVKEKRPLICPNLGFCITLQRYESKLNTPIVLHCRVGPQFDGAKADNRDSDSEETGYGVSDSSDDLLTPVTVPPSTSFASSFLS